MRISLLGPLEVTDDADRPVEVGGARLRTLLILLALDAPRVVTTDRLVGGVWGGDPPAGAPNALQSLISRLRRALPDAVIESHPSGYRLVLDDEAVDLRRFDRLVAHGRRLLADDPARAADSLAEALGLWRGTALADVADADFAQGQVSRLTEQRLGAIEDHSETLLLLGRADTAELEVLVAAHPLRERLRAQYMRALSAAGRQADALATFEDARRTLAEELGVDPSPELQAVHLAILRGEQTPARSRGRSNLPARLTSFIGREEEIERVGKLLAENRLVTLTGPGGAGKTRLSIEAAARLTDRMPGGVRLIELAPVGDPGEVPQALLSTLGLREAALTVGVRGAPPTSVEPVERLVAALADERLLIVLDNCEHLIDSCARLVDRVLADCPGVRVLATSREALGITGESLWPVPPLAFPPEDPSDAYGPGCVTSLGEAFDYPAVRLFVERGTAVRPGFTAETDLPAVLAICRRLDGMPLAIELAAARLRTMTATQVADRLDDRFRLLTGGSRTALPRHQTLRAVVDWSWDLLDDGERTLLRRISVFAGGATLDSVEEVCGGGVLDVLDALTGLVEKSLVSVDRTGRYRVLETIRAYGAERLGESGEATRVRRAHARHFLQLAETAEPLLRTREQLRWLEHLTAEYDNLHSALRWAIEVQDTALAVRYVAALGWFWFLRGQRVEGHQLARDALALPGKASAHAFALATLFWVIGSVDDDPLLREKEDLGRRISAALAGCAGLPPEDMHPIVRIAPLGLLMVDGRTDEALAGLDRLGDVRDPWLRAAFDMFRGHILINLGRVEGIDQHFTGAIDAFRALGERWGASLTLTGLAEIALWRGDPMSAKAHIEEALRCSLELGSPDDSSHLRLRLADAYRALGDETAAQAELEAARRGAERRGDHRDIAMVRYTTAEAARRRGDLAGARALLEDASMLAWSGGPPQFVSMINTQLGLIHGLEGDLDTALERHVEAFRTAWFAGDAPVAGQAIVGLADHAGRGGDHERAATLLGAAIGVRGVEDRSLADPPRIAEAAREALGDERFDTAYARGRAMGLEDAAAYLAIEPITTGGLTRGAAPPPA